MFILYPLSALSPHGRFCHGRAYHGRAYHGRACYGLFAGLSFLSALCRFVGYGFVILLSLQMAAFAQSRGLMDEGDMIAGAKSGNIGLMERGFIEGRSPNDKDFQGKPAILIGAEKGFTDVIKYLLYRRARVDERDREGNTALTAATARGDTQIMTLLLDAGADIDRPGVRQEVPIIIAARKQHIAAVRLLIERGAYLDDTDLSGRTAFDWAQAGRNRQIMELLETAR